MTESELRERAAAFHKALAAAQQEAGGCGLAAYVLADADGPLMIGGESVRYVDAAGKPLEEIEPDLACSLMAHVLARLELLKQQYGALFGAGFSVNLQRAVAQRLANSTETGLQPFEQAVADLAAAYAPALVLAATLGHDTDEGPIPGSSMASIAANIRDFDTIAPALAALRIAQERVLAGAAERCGLPLDEAKAHVAAAVEMLRRTGDFHEAE